MATSTDQPALTEDGLCKRCASIAWDEMAYAIEKHFPMLPRAANQRLEIFDINTTINDTRESLEASPCRFCQLLAKALAVHSLSTPGQLDCVHDGFSMASIQMESMTSALAVTLDDITRAEKRFKKEYANVTGVGYESIKAGLRSCERDHPDCVPDVLGDLPGFRLIDCETRVVTAASATKSHGTAEQSSGYNYVALSYVWGSKPDESFINEKGALESMPRTIADSIELCRALGYQYLWVDRYVSGLLRSKYPETDVQSALTRRKKTRRQSKLQTWEESTHQPSSQSSPLSAKTLPTGSRASPPPTS